MTWAEIRYGCTTWPLVVLGHEGGINITQRQTGNRNGGGSRPRGDGGEVRKSVSYISFIGGLFGFGQIKRNRGRPSTTPGTFFGNFISWPQIIVGCAVRQKQNLIMGAIRIAKCPGHVPAALVPKLQKTVMTGYTERYTCIRRLRFEK